MEVIVNEENQAIRLDTFVNLIDPNISRSLAQKLINDERVLVNDKTNKVSYKVKLNDKVFIPNNNVYIGEDKTEYKILSYRHHKDYEMIVVEGEVGYFLVASGIVFGFLLGEVGKDEVDEWDGFGDNLLILERVHSLGGEIGIDAILYEGVGDLYLVVVCHPEHIPILFLRWVRSIFYRHPSL